MRNRLASLSSLAAIGTLAMSATAGDAPTQERPAEIAPGQSLRVGGAIDAPLVVESRAGKTIYRSGESGVLEALPEGYPAPTPPEAIDLKRYPSVRRAEISGGGPKDGGMMGVRSSMAFWPLFQHIKRRDIPMTAPVEMDYDGLTSDAESQGWKMSFLYRTAELGDTGRDGKIVVYDTEPVTVIALGIRGGEVGETRMREALATLEAWVSVNPGWVVAGDPRKLGYNGPDVRRADRWWEIQIPVEAVGVDSGEAEARGEGR